jgi:FixJ family two-component response regulator
MSHPSISAPQVFIVDDDLSICEAMTNLLSSEGIPAASFSSAEQFLDSWQPHLAGCLLLDVRLPGITGVEFQDKLSKAGIAIPIIFMTGHGDVPMVRRVMKAGAIEFLTKPFQREELLAAVQEAFLRDHDQRAYRGELLALSACYDRLSAREREIMELVVSGLLNKQIADRLGLSEIMVKIHRRSVMDKMEATSLADLVRSAQTLRAAGIHWQ